MRGKKLFPSPQICYTIKSNTGNIMEKGADMNGLYANIKREKQKSKDKVLWSLLALVLCLTAIAIASVVWFLGYHGRFTDFVGNLSASTTYAYKNDCLIAKVNGRTFKLSEDNMYGIYAYLSLNKSGRESKKIPEGEPVELDYGNNTTLRLWDIPIEGGRHYLFIQYTDINGGIYSYISYKTTLDTVVVRYLTYGNEELTTDS